MSKKNGKLNDQSNLASSSEGHDLKALSAELEQVKSTADQLEAQLKRAVADYQNLEKRVIEGRGELAQWATTDLIRKLLPILYSFDQAITGVLGEERNSAWFKGVELIYKQLQDVLKSEGLDEIEADGKFDPAFHEAVDIAEGENDKILKIVQKGYILNGKILEPAKVVVGKKGD